MISIIYLYHLKNFPTLDFIIWKIKVHMEFQNQLLSILVIIYIPYFSIYSELYDITYFFLKKGAGLNFSITNQTITTNLFKKENGP